MTKVSLVKSAVPVKAQQKPPVPKVAAEFGKRAVELAIAAGFSPDDLAKGTGRKRNPTIDRLRAGKGSIHTAIAVRDFLVSKKVDISSLPPINSDTSQSEWLREWISVGKALHQFATPKEFEELFTFVRKQMNAHRERAEQFAKLS